MFKMRIQMIPMMMLAALAVACGSTHQSAWESTTESGNGTQSDEAQGDRDRLLEEGATAWADRDNAASVRTAIERWEAALSIDPNDASTWTSVSRARYFLADCHIRFEENQDEAFRDQFQQGTQAAERALVALNDDFADRMRAGTRIEEALDALDASAVPALYWRSSNLGKWASAEGFATLLSYKDEIRAVMSYCLEQDSDFYYSGPHRYFGVFYARAPSFAGGDLEQSREHFETSLRAYPNYFASHVLYAQDYATKAQERELYERELRWVLDNDPEALADVAPENRCEQRKARLLLEEIDDRF